MRLNKFIVKNYKIFKNEFSVDLIRNTVSNGNFTILTGKNNMGKSTFLEAINEFFKEPKKAIIIPPDCFNNKNETILLKAELSIDKIKDVELWELLIDRGYIDEQVEENQNFNMTKTFYLDKVPSYTGSINGKSILTKDSKDIAKLINREEPYYIRPNMTTEEIDKLINTIYVDAISASSQNNEDTLTVINEKIRDAMKDLKSGTDTLLCEVENKVSDILNTLFKNQDFKIKIEGGEVKDFSIKDLLKNTDTRITIDSNSRSDMLLAEQGTGVQRMSLIYTIHNIINQKIGNLGNRMLLIDEPEAFLHPEATRKLSSSLYDIGNIMPIIITTHSPVLINLENDHTVIDIFKIDKNNSDAITLYTSEESSFTSDDIENMKILNYVDSYVNEFFFSDKNIIVEGFTEKLVLEYIQKKYGLTFHVINANGKDTIRTIMKILNQFDAPYYVLHDIDNNPKHTQKALKADRTKGLNLFELKNDKTKIYAHNFTFEKAFYNETVLSSTKTKRIFEILDSKPEDSEKFYIKKDILETYNRIFELGIDELKCDICNDKVIEVVSENSIEDLFAGLIK